MGNMRYIFIGGAHKSGSTLLSRILSQSKEISTFKCTGAPMDEGQWLQSFLPQDQNLGELLFGLSDEAHLTENELNSDELAGELLKCWEPHWNLNCKLLLEKSPINVLRTRFLQSLFPDSVFLITIRDPRTSFMAAKKTMPHISVETYFKNWIKIYSKFKEDSIFLKCFTIIHYEALIQNPQKVLQELESLLEIKIAIQTENFAFTNIDQEYLEAWKKLKLKENPKSPIYNIYDYSC